MTACNIESTLLQTTFPFHQEGAQHCVCQIYPPVDPPGKSKSCRHQIIIPHVVEHEERVLSEEVPEYQKDNSGANRYNEIVCCVFESLLLYSPPL